MSEFIVEVPDCDANEFIERYGLDGTRMFGYKLTGEVVRCRGCRNGHQTPVRGFRCWHWMELDGNGDPVPADVEPDGFCAWGVRRPE